MKMGLKRRVASAAAVLTAASILYSQETNPFGPSPEVEAALRERVEGFYHLFQNGRFREAEQFVAEEGRDAYYMARKTRILEYEVKTVQFSPDLSEAQALVSCLMLVPFVGSKPVPVPLSSTWRRVEGEWFLAFEDRRIKDGQWDSPFGPMRFDTTPGEGNQYEGAGPAFTPEQALAQLKNLCKFDQNEVAFSSQSSRTQERTVTVSNLAQGKLQVTAADSLPQGLAVEINPAEIERGGTGTIRLIYPPGDEPLAGNYELGFLVMPIAQRITLKVSFR